jgi:hypothetical protein
MSDVVSTLIRSFPMSSIVEYRIFFIASLSDVAHMIITYVYMV